MAITFTLDQLARTSLLPESMSAAIHSGKAPNLSDLIPHLVIASLDSDATMAGDKNARWSERRISRQLLGLTFLAALLFDHIIGPEQMGAAGNTTDQKARP